MHTNGQRKKLWEIKPGYHCSIIGTCLRRSDLQKLARKRIFGIDDGADDYQIHSILVNVAGSRCEQARLLHKVLDSKFRLMTARFAKAGDEEGLRQAWLQAVDAGEIAGGYWAAITHPAATRELSADLYGTVHMLGFDYFSERQRESRLLEEVRQKARALEDVLGSERDIYLRERKSLEEEIAGLHAALHEAQESKILHETGSTPLMVEQLEEARTQLAALRRDNAALCGQVDALTLELEDTHDLVELANRTAEDLQRGNKQLLEKQQEMQQEIISLETAMILKMAVANRCSSCEDQDTARCPGPDLCGKTVLYVGGLHKMVPHYKQLVEKCGGRFLHHDGGKEVSRNILPKLLCTADAVLCPVDCVSHDACNCVKKMCKRYQKPFVMMRSSGLSSLAKGLNDIVQ